jgi:hypothetical protein
LKNNYSKEEYETFINALDFDYDSSQELYGIIWYKDGTWSMRDEYDGWVHYICPEIYDELIE